MKNTDLYFFVSLSKNTANVLYDNVLELLHFFSFIVVLLITFLVICIHQTIQFTRPERSFNAFI